MSVSGKFNELPGSSQGKEFETGIVTAASTRGSLFFPASARNLDKRLPFFYIYPILKAIIAHIHIDPSEIEQTQRKG